MSTPQSAEFAQAVKDSRNLKAKPTNDELLELYALFKEGTQDPPFEEATKPGMLDITGKAKYKEWTKLHEQGMTPADAQQKYVEAVKKLQTKYGVKE